jgi:hypothetical protein
MSPVGGDCELRTRPRLNDPEGSTGEALSETAHPIAASSLVGPQRALDAKGRPEKCGWTHGHGLRD